MNVLCSAFRNKISHGSILSIAIKFAFSGGESYSNNFDDFMKSAHNLNFNDDCLSSFQSDKADFLEHRFQGFRHVNFDLLLDKTSMKIKVNMYDLIKQIENKIKSNENCISTIKKTILKMNNRD